MVSRAEAKLTHASRKGHDGVIGGRKPVNAQG